MRKKYFKFGLISLILLINCNISIAAPKQNIKIQQANNVVLNEPQQVLKVNFFNKESSSVGKTFLKLKSLIEGKTNGKLTIELYPFNNLLDNQNEFEALELGIVDVIIPNTNKISNYYNIQEYQLFDLPYLFANDNDFQLFINSKKNEDLLSLINQKNKNIKAISFFGDGFKGISSNKPIIKYDDFKGLIIGSQSTEIGKKTLNNLNVLNIDVNEQDMKNYLETKKINSSEVTVSNFNYLDLNKHQKYYLATNHKYSVSAVLFNENKLNSINPEFKKIVVDSFKEIQSYQIESSISENESSLLEIKTKNVVLVEVNESFKRLLKEKLSIIHEDFIKDNRQLMLDIYKILLNEN